ncbi:zinc transporter ZntB [Photobacterium leiognathi]|uniref:zinc transporter ZntB n=1 Tax=Photobacterium leiognathi TaxID=553611 RepID=UPI0002088447|nr:zinc transporter ZntB [Photobacterium leiognathi]PSV03125.1 zinc transporter ZntB [Photobacterium leiognathi subsp. mandapamensis]PSW53370.1 zinc transporter ZntB [Photobacterium leiognathi subsp. mandapamensis]GAA04060.1 corA-like Mg2+ transporter family protein [Photobacterium leiognathi subsp. mandapamensis svers.1.1.]
MKNEFVYSYQLDASNASKPLTLDQVNQWSSNDGLLWLHLNYTDAQALAWIQNSDLPDIEKDALTTRRIRPRLNQTKEGFFLSLRGIDLESDSPSDVPAEMVSIRGYYTKNMIVTTSDRPVRALDRVSAHIMGGYGPKTIGAFILCLCDHLTSHKIEVIDSLDDKLTALEDQVMNSSDENLRNNIAVLRRETVYLRRYVTPQRDAIAKLLTIDTPLLSLSDKQKIHEVNEKLIHVLDDLNAIRERANVTQEELMSLQSEALNQRLYFLSLITTIFLPLGFMTGLLGVNLGGIPGAQYHWAFFIFCGLLFGVLILQLVLFYRKKWI